MAHTCTEALHVSFIMCIPSGEIQQHSGNAELRKNPFVLPKLRIIVLTPILQPDTASRIMSANHNRQHITALGYTCIGNLFLLLMANTLCYFCRTT